MQKNLYQVRIWRLRYSLGWSLDRIGRQFGVSRSAVSQLLRRTRPSRIAKPVDRPFQPKRRTVRPVSLAIISDA